MDEKEAHFRKLERLYGEAPINRTEPAPRIKVGDGRAEVKMQVDPEQYHGGGALHGSILFKMLDDAAFFAANSKVRDAMVLTVQFEVHFSRPVREGELTAIAELRTPGRKLLVATAKVLDEKGREIAFGTGTFTKSAAPSDKEG